MRWCVLVFAGAFGALWGVVQGMVMVQPRDVRADQGWFDIKKLGVRSHLWFGAYHLLCVGMMAVFLALVIAWDIWSLRQAQGPGKVIAWTLGCGFLGWEASEMGYAQARWKKWIPKTERLTLLDVWALRVDERWMRHVHAARVAAGVVLLILGGML
jgi:hypothetical protein